MTRPGEVSEEILAKFDSLAVQHWTPGMLINWHRIIAEVRRLRGELAATNRELERWRHGVPVEGDYVCPDSLEVERLRGEVERLRGEVNLLHDRRLLECKP